MALLSDDMRILAQNLLQEHDNRMEAVADLRTNVRQGLNNNRTVQRALSAEQEKALAKYMEVLRCEVAEASLATRKFLKEVDAYQQTMSAEQRQKLGEHMLSLRGQVTDFLKEIDQEHQAMTGEQRQYLAEQMDGLHHQVSDLRQAAAAFLGELDKSNQSMAEELNLKLIEQRSGLATDTAAFINTISSAHQEMATQLAQELHQSVSTLRRNAATFLKASGAAHRSMATAQKQGLTKGRDQLMAEVTATREKYQAELGVVRIDLAEAAKIWANISHLKQKSRIKKGPAKSSRAAESARGTDSPAEPSGPDDFKVIHGIGHGMANLLYTAGISSFAQLAASTPEQLRQVLGKTGKLAKVESWIAQAQDLIRLFWTGFLLDDWLDDIA